MADNKWGDEVAQVTTGKKSFGQKLGDIARTIARGMNYDTYLKERELNSQNSLRDAQIASILERLGLDKQADTRAGEKHTAEMEKSRFEQKVAEENYLIAKTERDYWADKFAKGEIDAPTFNLHMQRLEMKMKDAERRYKEAQVTSENAQAANYSASARSHDASTNYTNRRTQEIDENAADSEATRAKAAPIAAFTDYQSALKDYVTQLNQLDSFAKANDIDTNSDEYKQMRDRIERLNPDKSSAYGTQPWRAYPNSPANPQYSIGDNPFSGARVAPSHRSAPPQTGGVSGGLSTDSEEIRRRAGGGR